MRTFVSLVFVSLAFAPAAAAIDVQVLEGGGKCVETSGWGHWSRQCEDDFDYARAQAGPAEVYASAHHENASTYEYHAGSDDSGSSASWSDEWDRRAGVKFAGERVEARRGCASSSERHQSTTYGDTWAYSMLSSENGYRCDQAGASAGHGVDAAVVDACSSEFDVQDQYSWESGGSGWAYMTRSDSCSAGVDAGAASAALGNGCADHGWHAFGEGSTSYSWWECRTGVFSQGPDGMGLFVGFRQQGTDECYDEDGSQVCSSWSMSAVAVESHWEHNPVSPHPWGVYLPLA